MKPSDHRRWRENLESTRRGKGREEKKRKRRGEEERESTWERKKSLVKFQINFPLIKFYVYNHDLGLIYTIKSETKMEIKIKRKLKKREKIKEARIKNGNFFTFVGLIFFFDLLCCITFFLR